MNFKQIFFGFFLFSFAGFSQTPDRQKFVVDSLTKELVTATNDTTKIRLRYYLGFNKLINRETFWDSLIADTRTHGSVIFEKRALGIFGRFLLQQGNEMKSLDCFKKSYQLAKSIGIENEIMGPCYYLTVYYINHNNTKKALDYCYEGLKAAEKVNQKTYIVHFKGILGTIFLQTGDFKNAIKTHHDYLRLAQELNLKEACVRALLELGTDYINSGDDVNAIKYYLMSLRYVDLSVVTDLNAQVCLSLGAAYEKKNMPDSAAFYFLKGYNYYSKLEHKTGSIGAMTVLADHYLKRGDTKKALQYAMETYKQVNLTGYKIQLPSLTRIIKEIYLKEKNYKEAFKWYGVETAARDSVSNEKSRKQALEKEFAFNIEKKENENKLLANQNQIQLLQLSQFRYFVYGLVILLVLVLLIALLIIRQNKLKTEKQTSDLEQKLLRTQMNPHFIYNSLQAIQNFILKRDEKEAVRYLSSFASVTRNVLENSRMEAIPVQKEIALLENYLQLQKLRFGNRFEYQIQVDDKIDREHAIIPPMLAQPFIENAIEHGMHGIESGGQIDVNYYIEKNSLVIEVKDNGSGMQYSDPPTRKHRSLALAITKERIALMNKKAKKKVDFSISEAFPGTSERKGVKVRFNLPLEHVN
jgi:TPR repeat protein/two-component sensor histidine kinase